MNSALALDAAAGFSAGLSDLPVALQSLRQRQLDLCGRLDAADWKRPSRCHLWTVHDVVRHVRDACRVHIESLRGRPTPFTSDTRFDARQTPLRWLEGTAGQTPAETVAELSDLCAEEATTLDARLEQGDEDPVEGPYGPVHRTTLTTHVFWDGWLHHGDVTQALGIDRSDSGVEVEVAALYGLLIASMPAALKGSPLDLSVGLETGDGPGYSASIRPGRVILGLADAAFEPDLHGELIPVVEALAGRGPELGAVLHGEPAAIEPLTWLRSILLPAT